MQQQFEDKLHRFDLGYQIEKFGETHPEAAEAITDTLGVGLQIGLAAVTEGGSELPELAVAASRVGEIAGVLGKTKDFVTIAVTETEEGVNVVSSSETALRPAVQAMLKEGEVGATGAGHAEVTGVNAAREMGLTPTGVAASRPVCPSCAAFLRQAGVRILSPLKY